MYDYNEYFNFVVENIEEELLPQALYDEILLSLDALVNDLYHAGVGIDRASWLVSVFLIRFKKYL
jgi:hypothetical protein